MQEANPLPINKYIPDISGQDSTNATIQEGGISCNPTHTNNTHSRPPIYP